MKYAKRGFKSEIFGTHIDAQIWTLSTVEYIQILIKRMNDEMTKSR